MTTDNKDPLLMDHDADGITELDNNLPQWWVWLFVLTCVWAAGYLVYFHLMDGPGQIARYEQEMAAAATSIAAATPAPAAPGEAAPAAAADEPSTDEAILAQGKDLYIKNCLVCHAPDGGGLIGPNMTDDFYIHGPLFSDSVRIINEGVVAKGMIPWKGVLKPDEIHAVASYIFTLRGTTPAAPKAPEGTQAQL
ncbi:MAG TPA: cbb3-type cytochrome c oxidase N-terminal domain-containing protein [Kiritimatiellia bacterium]|nr:cbb3-type cytochrome c oxidase N-terminal domain-containing protein [Kiritimatiellia bacterium]HMP33570.1 cbb3-type cytochrome c oxidase N-terminal domain-containing protein [Kiritimatiellia bacterium]